MRMLQEMTLIAAESDGIASRVASEFPTIVFWIDDRSLLEPHVTQSDWDSRAFDAFRFDFAIDGVERLVIRGERPPFAMEVLNRVQRLIARRNGASEGSLFDRVLERHRALHDLSKPLVRADYNHALDVWQWLLRLDPGASLALQLAALFHDVERLVSEADARVEHLAADYQQFKDAHAAAGAAMTRAILRECGVAEDVGEEVADLIAHHEHHPDLLADADALSFFSLNSPGYADYFGPEQTRRKVAYSWNRLRPESRSKLASVRLRADVKEMLDALHP
jgi:hypothetical protein